MTARAIVASTGLILLGACASSVTDAPPRLPLTVTAAAAAASVVKGATLQLDVIAADSAGPIPAPSLSWSSSATGIATVGPTGGVTGIEFGVAVITATAANGKSASVQVLVTAPPRVAHYSVVDLSPVPTPAPSPLYAPMDLNDSGHVLVRGFTGASSFYRNGAGTSLPGCPYAWALNNLSHVLCDTGGGNTPPVQARRYVLWNAGVVTPVVAADTFTAGFLTLGALNDSDVVAGPVIQPNFTNVGCPAGGRCLMFVKNGVPVFKPNAAPSTEFPTQLNIRRDLVIQGPNYMPNSGTNGAYRFLWASGLASSYPVFVRAQNDLGALALEENGLDRAISRFYTVAVIVQPDGTRIALGEGTANGINNAGAVVGRLAVGPFLWTSGAVSLLTKAAVDQGWTITDALKINAKGQILAKASHSDGRTEHYIVLTPTTP
jgi:hypothetical protein